MNKDQIKDTIETSKKDKWPYPRIFEELRGAGVDSYEVVLDDFEATYFGGDQTWKKPISVDLPALNINNTFFADKLPEIWDKHQIGDMPYDVFLLDAAGAGVKGYRVDMSSRTITCYGIDTTQQHSESIS